MTCGQVGGFSRGTPVSSTNNGDRHDITEILLKVALNTIIIILSAVLQLVDCFYGSGKPENPEKTIYLPQVTDKLYGKGVRVMIFNAIFNNISAISWWSV
jgi:hypothetical protein